MSTLAVEHSESVPWSSAPRAPRVRAAHKRRVLRLADAAVDVDLSCALGAALVTWTFAAGFLPTIEPGHSVAAYWTAGLAGTVWVLVSLLLHELGHALAARGVGLGVSRITLSFVGGGSEIVGPIRSAGDALMIALAGPVASFVTIILATTAHLVLVETTGPGLPATVAALVACANVGLLLVNAIPGLPFDGGRALAAAAWAVTRRPDAAARIVRAIGRGMSHAMLGLALLASTFGFVWLALVAGVLCFVVREAAAPST